MGETKIERNKFLTEVMGGCWHEEYRYMYDIADSPKKKALQGEFSETMWDIVNNQLACEKCLSFWGCGNSNVDFSTWEGFGKLWEWAKQQSWWVDFNVYLALQDDSIVHYIHPDKFADAVYEYLKEKQ